MSQTSRARALAPIAGFTHQQAITHLQALTIGPRGESDYIDELRGGATVKGMTCECGQEFLMALDAQGAPSAPTEFHFGFDPRDGGQLRVSDTCPRCTLMYSMVEWFEENYEDPANGVPHDSGEGGYQYFNGGPYDPNEVLQEEYPEAPLSVVEAACEHIYGNGADWVRKGDY